MNVKMDHQQSKSYLKKRPGSWLAAGKCLCPQCRTGYMFKFPAWNWLKAYDMHEDCSVCGLHFEVEPGFFWGAMYINYAFGVSISVVAGALTAISGQDPELWVYIVAVITPLILLSPQNMRYSRVLMLYLFGGISFRP